MGRQLLQEPQPQQATSCQQLGGISSGGWIALSLLAGILAGVAGTLLFQCYRRRKQLKYMATAPVASQYHRSAASLQPAVLVHQPSAAAPQPAPQQQKYFSPLSKSLSAGTSGLVHAVQLSQGGTRSSLRMTEAGDINSRGMHDQHSTMDVHAHTLPLQMSATNPFATQEVAVGGRQLQAQVPHAQQHPVAAVGWGSHMEMQRNAYPSAGTRMQAPQQASSPDSSTGPITEYQLPASIIPQALSSPGPSSPSDYPAPGAHAVPGSSSTTHSVGPHAHAAARSAHTASVSPSARPGSVAAAGGSRPSGGSSGMLRPEASTASTAAELEDEYAVEDLDEDWKSLLTDVDARLLAQGAHVMTDRERAVAIKKLLVATGTRGVDFAMAATLQEVLRFRKFHGSS